MHSNLSCVGAAAAKAATLVATMAAVIVVSGCRDESPDFVEPQSSAAVVSPNFDPALGTLSSPVRVVSIDGGGLLVSDSRRREIVSVDPSTLLPATALDVGGRPLAVGVLGGYILVGNVDRRTIEVYDSRGRLRSFYGPGAVQKPVDLATDDDARLVFALDGAAMAVKVFDHRGRPVRTISGPGAAPDRLVLPMGIAVDVNRREVLVSDQGDLDVGASSIKIFDYDGNFVAEISGKGRCGLLGCSGGFSTPQGLDVDAAGRIYLADLLLAQVLVFDRAGLKLVGTLGGRDQPPGLRIPLDVSVGADGDVFVTSNRTGTVEVFRGAAGS